MHVSLQLMISQFYCSSPSVQDDLVYIRLLLLAPLLTTLGFHCTLGTTSDNAKREQRGLVIEC